MRILLSGASGFVGSRLSLFLSERGHLVVPLKRGEHFPLSEPFDAVIHLAGEPIWGRWTAEKRKKILSSRVESTTFLSDTLASLRHPPKVFLIASAVGYYGDRVEEILTETSAPGNSFLADVCEAWEGASVSAVRRGIRTIHTRFGMVLGKGGALQAMKPLFQWGLGGALGSGAQWVSWIALEDLVRAIDFLLQHPHLKGPINLTAPEPIRQKEFAREWAHFLHRPCWLRTPAWVLKLFLGSMAQELLLSSARVFPEQLQKNGFTFMAPTLQKALSQLEF